MAFGFVCLWYDEKIQPRSCAGERTQMAKDAVQIKNFQKTITEQTNTIEEKEKTIVEKETIINRQNNRISTQEKQLEEAGKMIFDMMPPYAWAVTLGQHLTRLGASLFDVPGFIGEMHILHTSVGQDLRQALQPGRDRPQDMSEIFKREIKKEAFDYGLTLTNIEIDYAAPFPMHARRANGINQKLRCPLRARAKGFRQGAGE
jgi:hypothetical protein